MHWHMQGNKHSEVHKSQELSQHIWMIRRWYATFCCHHQSKWWSLQSVTKHLFVHFYHKCSVKFFTPSVLSKKFSPLIPSEFGRLPCTDDRNYRPHLQLIYLCWSPDDRGSVCPIYSRPYLLIIDQFRYPSQERKSKAVLCWTVGVEVQSHTSIIFGRIRITYCLFFLLL